jgi:LmbE family N-acetylglucosaminyl deacetylase
VLPLGLTPPPGRPLSVLAVGAHPDDIEIGAGGLLLSLAGAPHGLSLHYLVLTGTPARHNEARAAAAALASACTTCRKGGCPRTGPRSRT